MDLKRWNLVGIATLSIMLAMLAISAWFAYGVDHTYPSTTSEANVVFNLLGMIICTVIFASVLFDQRMSVETLLFMCLLTIETLLLFWDLMNWIIDGNPAMAQMTRIVNYYIYGLMIIIIATFWYYLRELFSKHHRQLRRYSQAIVVLFFVGILLIVTNPFTGLYFYVDSDTGFYTRTDTFVVSVIAPLLMILLELHCIFRFESDRRRKAVLATYLILPLIATVVQVAFYGISLQYVSMTMSLVLMYANLYADRSSELMRNEAQMTEQRAAVMVSQIQPHFLYNALTSIMNIKGNPSETRDAIADFGRYMRSNLDSITQKAPVPFTKEMDYVETYYNLRKLRFGDRLEMVTDLRDRSFLVPPQCVKLLVATLIEFTLVRKDAPVVIHVDSAVEGDRHTIRVYGEYEGDLSSVSLDREGLEEMRHNNDRLRSMVSGTLSDEVDGEGRRAAVIRIPLRKGEVP